MQEQARVGLLGIGRIGLGHAAILRDLPRVTELVLADALPGHAAAVATDLGVTHTDINTLFDRERVDCLVIATGTDTHADLLVRAAETQMPVFCEKPVATDITDARRAIDALEAAGTLNHIGFHRRFDPGYLEAKRRLESGELGELRRIHLLSCDMNTPDPAFIPTSGGIFRDCMIHDFDILRWTTGQRVHEVHAYGTAKGDPVYSASQDASDAVLLLTLEDGTLGTAHTSRYNGAGHDVRMELAGDKGGVVVGLDDRAPLRSAEPGHHDLPGPVWTNFLERFAPCYAAELAAFVDAVLDDTPSPCTAADALEALYVATAATTSYREGRPVLVEDIRAS
ncbi:myo-inositol 2-dehydrogenase / D-chiro-inositol 1-dehydrogenase [Austwickia chelonae]|uniref:Putative oxidoreductase n=1 Tax=Austwickia chelonae NBRC 105200 TaxID=1184607 RepID=K6VRP8_9MICO|nr:Gfo/Idh/MocA family oxidoreductase [Austwickia chelonae]GAB77995.1 putative oxidoreductase [Austwickia chelonae NBRC 105200]SEV93910.1 myo-inositol 2-dehydrogenase / D-chiro-inositol 1-dehydrogenase [Austwickia chelonae]